MFMTYLKPLQGMEEIQPKADSFAYFEDFVFEDRAKMA